jgi:hypothetical protein
MTQPMPALPAPQHSRTMKIFGWTLAGQGRGRIFYIMGLFETWFWTGWAIVLFALLMLWLDEFIKE